MHRPPPSAHRYTAELAELGNRRDFDACIARGDALRFLGRVEESEEAFHAALAKAGRRAERQVLAKVGLANVACARARWAEARALLEGLRVRDRRLAARIYGIVASTHFNEHHLDGAEGALERALDIQRSLRDRQGEAVSTTSLGIVAFARGETSRAFAQLDEGRALAQRAGLEHWEAMAKSYRAMLRHDAGDFEGAARLYEESVGDLDRIGVRRAEGLTLFGRALLHLERKRLDEAESDLRDALSGERATSPDYEPLLVAAQAVVAHARGDTSARDHQLRFAADCLERRGPRFAFVVDTVRATLVEGHGFEGLAAEPTIEARLVARALGAVAGADRKRRLRVGDDATWFEVDGGARVDLSRRHPLRRILLALIERHRSGGAPLTVEALVRAGWPGQRLVGSTGATRLYTAIASLRRMGLQDVLLRSGAGYVVDAAFVARG